MTDKEKIIIDGVDVSKCKFINNIYFSPCGGCKNDDNCYYKQLQRKEQECEKWKEKWNIGFQKFCDKDNELQRYKQALDEVEQLIKNMEADECVYNDFDCSNCSEDNTCPTKVKSYILKIIKKAKDGE